MAHPTKNKLLKVIKNRFFIGNSHKKSPDINQGLRLKIVYIKKITDFTIGESGFGVSAYLLIK